MLKLWLIHKKAYRETSLLTTVLTEENQLVKGVVRGGRGVLSEFQPLYALIKHNRRSSLASLSRTELAGPRLPLAGKELISGLYVNEITTVLIPERATVDGLFGAYRDTLIWLSRGKFSYLRYYERFLLDASGVYPELQVDRLGEPLEAESFYRLNQFENLVEVESNDCDALMGADWTRLSEGEYETPKTALHAKWLHRNLICHVTGGRRLFSRDLLNDLGMK